MYLTTNFIPFNRIRIEIIYVYHSEAGDKDILIHPALSIFILLIC